MKKLLTLIVVSIILTTISCKKEEAPEITNVSTAYKALFMKWTSTTCSPCGGAMKLFKDLKAQYPGDFLLINMYSSWGSGSPGFYDFYQRYNISATPTIAVHCDTTMKRIYSNENVSYIQKARTTKAKAGIGISKSISGNTIEIKTKTVFFEDITGSYNLAVYIVEDGKMEEQYGYSTDAIAHDNIYRGEANKSAFGKNIVSNPSKNQIVENTYSYTLPSSVVASNAHVIAVIWKMGADNKPVEMINSNRE